MESSSHVKLFFLVRESSLLELEYLGKLLEWQPSSIWIKSTRRP